MPLLKKILSMTTLALLLTVSMASFSHAVEKKKEPGKKIDLALTLKYIQDWSARDKWDKFPESPSFAYYNIYSLKALNADISPALRKKVVDMLRSCQMKDGGFSAGPGYGTNANTIFTYYSLATLDLLNALDSIDRKQAVSYIRSLIQKDGSIKVNAVDQNATLATTYYGIASLGILNALDGLDKKGMIAFINTYREDHKGYCLVPDKISMPGSTFMAIKSLSLIGGLTPDIRTEVVTYLKETRYSGLVKNKKYTSVPGVEDMAAVLLAFDELSSLNVIDKRKVYTFIESLYIPENGGFGPEPGLGTTPPGTYYAIVCLDRIGNLAKQAPGK